ncbi:uncharacterized protein EDB91DRAFT_1249091 [Suillus paluster]|uniref:uncharacterized protein n=1 Tax=Suillus paluster TaxID=48578 RepID=UPI001B87CD21|nr:uncharacterized protein EDB91DRAFT_1249091 [Suillus paluster]KAG1738916.1 hypothetical protein EDB91DRAFT_1249091 [Suillus paluster]
MSLATITPTTIIHDNSSSDSEPESTQTSYPHVYNIMKTATVDQSSPSKPPKLLVGELTPKVVCDWENACSTYFMHKEIEAKNQGMRDFYEWALELQNQNTLLFGNAAHLSDAQLCNQLEANICDELITPVLRAKLDPTMMLKKWIKEVCHLDDKHLEDLAMHKKSKECPDGPPDASSYKTLTEADAIAAKPVKNDRLMKPIAAVAPVAAVMPLSVLEEVLDSDDDMCIAPFETNHLLWSCLLAGPSSPSFECINTLIDHGSHLVLINEDLVTKLGLKRRKLHVEIQANSVFLALSTSPLTFSEYVHVSPSSLNHDWISRTGGLSYHTIASSYIMNFALASANLRTTTF